MKSIFFTFSLLLLIGSAGKAQTWAEFFKQKKPSGDTWRNRSQACKFTSVLPGRAITSLKLGPTPSVH
ncbi:hypothetical protein [Pedobacter panaciterrae]